MSEDSEKDKLALADVETGDSLSNRRMLPDEGKTSSENDTKVYVKRKLKSQKRTLLKRGTKKIRVPRYFTAGVNVNESNAKDINKEPSPFLYPANMKEFAHNVINRAWRDDRRIKELKQKFWNRPNFKERQTKDLLHRLYVKEDSSKQMESLLDINPDFFTVTQGRPIPEKLDIRQYIETIRDSLKTKVLIGFREDDMMLIDETLTVEQKIIDTVRENLQGYINIFEEFLLDDHLSAMKLISESDKARKHLYDKQYEHNMIAKKYAIQKCSLYALEEKWRLCKIFQKFLYVVSPLQWRREQSSQRNTEDLLERPSDDFAAGTFKFSDMAEDISIQDIIQEFNEETTQRAPKLYFTEPEQLMDVFRFVEVQNLNSLLHCEELAKPLEHIKESMRGAVENLDQEIKNLQEIAHSLEGGILWEEKRVEYLENIAKDLLGNEFRNLIVEEEMLNLHVIVEDIYEARIGPNDANITCIRMMQAIEELYRQELIFFDSIPSEEVAKLEVTYYKEERMRLVLASKAAKDFNKLQLITNNVMRAFDPPKKARTTRELKRRTAPINSPKKIEEPPRSLTERETDFLEHFTQFCNKTDDPKKYGIDTSKDEDAEKLVTPLKSTKDIYKNIMD